MTTRDQLGIACSHVMSDASFSQLNSLTASSTACHVHQHPPAPSLLEKLLLCPASPTAQPCSPSMLPAEVEQLYLRISQGYAPLIHGLGPRDPSHATLAALIRHWEAGLAQLGCSALFQGMPAIILVHGIEQLCRRGATVSRAWPAVVPYYAWRPHRDQDSGSDARASRLTRLAQARAKAVVMLHAVLISTLGLPWACWTWAGAMLDAYLTLEGMGVLPERMPSLAKGALNLAIRQYAYHQCGQHGTQLELVLLAKAGALTGLHRPGAVLEAECKLARIAHSPSALAGGYMFGMHEYSTAWLQALDGAALANLAQPCQTVPQLAAAFQMSPEQPGESFVEAQARSAGCVLPPTLAALRHTDETHAAGSFSVPSSGASLDPRATSGVSRADVEDRCSDPAAPIPSIGVQVVCAAASCGCAHALASSSHFELLVCLLDLLAPHIAESISGTVSTLCVRAQEHYQVSRYTPWAVALAVLQLALTHGNHAQLGCGREYTPLEYMLCHHMPVPVHAVREVCVMLRATFPFRPEVQASLAECDEFLQTADQDDDRARDFHAGPGHALGGATDDDPAHIEPPLRSIPAHVSGVPAAISHARSSPTHISGIPAAPSNIRGSPSVLSSAPWPAGLLHDGAPAASHVQAGLALGVLPYPTERSPALPVAVLSWSTASRTPQLAGARTAAAAADTGSACRTHTRGSAASSCYSGPAAPRARPVASVGPFKLPTGANTASTGLGGYCTPVVAPIPMLQPDESVAWASCGQLQLPTGQARPAGSRNSVGPLLCQMKSSSTSTARTHSPGSPAPGGLCAALASQDLSPWPSPGTKRSRATTRSGSPCI